MTARRIGLAIGVLGLAGGVLLPTPAGMEREAFVVAGLVVLMAAWWMTEAIPLTATALMPFVVLPLDFAIVVVSAVAICFVSTIYPSRQASRLDPVQALRFE